MRGVHSRGAHAGTLLQLKLRMALLQVLEQLHCAFKVVEGLLPTSGCDFDQRLTVIHILHNLLSLGDKLSATFAQETSDLRGWLILFLVDKRHQQACNV